MSTTLQPPSAALGANVPADSLGEIVFVDRQAQITDDKGAVIFQQDNVLAPASWSQNAVNIVASKYFHGQLGSPERESSVDQLVRRVVNTITGWGYEDNY